MARTVGAEPSASPREALVWLSRSPAGLPVSRCQVDGPSRQRQSGKPFIFVGADILV